MKNFKVICCFLLMFALGVATGALAVHMIYKSRMDSFLRGDHKVREEILLKRLSNRLDLDDRQRDQVRGVIHETQVEMQKIRSQYRPQIEAVLDRSRNEVRKILRPEQQGRFDQFVAEHKARWQKK